MAGTSPANDEEGSGITMNGRLASLVSVGCALLLAPVDLPAQDAVAEFYRGRQIRISVGFSPGGSSSLYAQALARHMGQYVPGNPALIVQHMPGAGGLVAANYVYNNAARDGSEFAITSRTAAMEPLLGNQNAKFDPLKLNWIGNANIENSVCVAWHTAPVKTVDDVFTQELIVGGGSTASQEVMFPRAFNRLLGAKFKIVTGYPGSTEILLAMERGEVQGFCGIGWTFVKLRKGDWLKEKKINVLFQMALAKHPDILHVPAILDYARSADDRQVLELLFAPQEMGRPFFAPPGIPAERVAALRTAFARTLKDAKFLEEAEKQGIEVQPVTGEEIQKLLERIYASPKAVVDRAKAVTE
jgi:tripartite-type tricarboxylate transporter receptor subunit TctC